MTSLPLPAYWRDHATWSYVPRNLTLYSLQDTLPGVFGQNALGPQINGSLWSLFYEVACYGVVVLLGQLGVLRRGWGFAAFFVIAVIAQVWAASHTPADGLLYRLRTLAFYGFPFALGIAAYVWRNSLPIRGWLALTIWLLPVALFTTVYEATALMIALAYTSYYLAFVPQGPILFYNRAGDYSYGIYIYAFPVQQIFVHYFPKLSAAQHMACAAPVVLLCAMASWHGLESHALALARPLANRWGAGTRPT